MKRPVALIISDLAGYISFIGVKRFYIKDFKVGSKTGCDLERYCIAGAQSVAGTEGISEKMVSGSGEML